MVDLVIRVLKLYIYFTKNSNLKLIHNFQIQREIFLINVVKIFMYIIINARI